MEKQSENHIVETSKPLLKDCLTDSKVLITSCFGIGFIPWAPGTFGSLFGLLFLAAFNSLSTPKGLLFPFLIMLTVISSYICSRVLEQYKINDPSWIVIDEFLGILLGYLCYPGHNPYHLLLLFILFRFFDIAKPWPISWADKMKTGFGVILDDLMAGVFAGLVLYLLKVSQII